MLFRSILGLNTQPRPVRELLRLVHIEGIELAKAKGEDLAIAEQLKRSNARLYERMRSAVREQSGRRQGRTKQ